MKFTSMFFTASAGYLNGERKDTNKRARNMKLLQCFSQRVQGILAGTQRYKQTSEKHEVTSMFFTASAGYLNGERKDTKRELQIGI